MNDLDLVFITYYLKSNFYKLVLSGFVAILFAFIYVSYSPVKYTASLSYSELSKANADVFYNLNNALSSFLKQKDSIDDAIDLEINSSTIAISFSEYLRDSDVIKKVLSELGIIDNNINVLHFSKNSKVNFIRRENQYSTNFNFSIKHVDRNIAELYLETLFKFASLYTVRSIIDSVQNIADNAELEKKISINLLEKQINIERLFAKRRTEDKIIFLKEQAELARLLGIATPVVTTPLEINIEGEKSFNKLYLEGYEALEGEIEILRVRESHDPFMLNVRNIEKQIENLRIYNEVEILEHYLTEVSIDTEPVTYNLYDISTSKSISISILYILAFCLGFSLCAILLIYYRVYFFKNAD